MARLEDYQQALILSKEALEDKDPKRIAAVTGADFFEENAEEIHLIVPFLNRRIMLTWPRFTFSFENSVVWIELFSPYFSFAYAPCVLGFASINFTPIYLFINSTSFYKLFY